MDFRFTPEDDAFRREVQEFLKRELPDWWHDTLDFHETDEAWQFVRRFHKRLASRGWLAMAWPKQYGGQGAPVFQQMIFAEELAYNDAPGVDQGIMWVGPAILLYGNEEQKRLYIPKITGADVVFCTLYTEPGAGSDLAALQTKAIKDGDDYVIIGQKIFNSNADRADYGWLAARTDPTAPKHRGISTFVVDMKSPGITVRRLQTLGGLYTSNEVFLDEVRIPKDNLVGEENRGWYQMNASLDFERSGAATSARAKRVLEDLVEYAKATRRNGHALSKEPRVRTRLAQTAIEIEVARYMSYRVGSLQQRGESFNIPASLTKVFGTELSMRLYNTGMQIMGLHGLLKKGSKHAELGGKFAFNYLQVWGNMWGAGSSEIQRNIIANRGLGLPR